MIVNNNSDDDDDDDDNNDSSRSFSVIYDSGIASIFRVNQKRELVSLHRSCYC